MSAAEEYRNNHAQLLRVVAQGTQRISLVEFATIPQLQGLIDELHAEHPERSIRIVSYDPAQITVPMLLDDCRDKLAETSAQPLPLLILRPRELRATPEDERAAFDFWQAMNFRRELFGQLPAQILLCVDPWNRKWLVDRAADLWSWLMPKIRLIPPPDLEVSPAQSLPALSFFTDYQMSPQAAKKQWQNSWPLLEGKKNQHRIDPGDFRRLVFPLMEAAFATGNLVRARKVRDSVAGVSIPDVDKIQWHKLNAQLACGAGDFSQAEEHAYKLLGLAKSHPDPQIQANAVGALSTLANLLCHFGQADATEALNRETLSISQSLFGGEHPHTLTIRNNLATALNDQGKYVDAEREHRAVLAIRERMLGPEHSDVLQSRHNLGTALGAQGKNAEAEREFRAVMAVRNHILGPEHPLTLSTRNNLANALSAQGKYAEAEQEHRAILPDLERVLGPEHPTTLWSRSNLASALHYQGKFEAEREQRAVLTVMERVLGPEHPATLSSRNNLGNALHAQGKYAEAEQEHRIALALRERVLGPEHPATLGNRNNLAATLRAQGKFLEAEEEHRARIAIEERVLGPEHPYVLRSRNNLANTLGAQGKYIEAEQELQAVLPVMERVLGPEHPDLFQCCHNLALSLRGQKRMNEALQFAKRAEQGWQKVFGPEHPYSQNAKILREGIEAALKNKE
jgi:tetratricopeptide (TPR) repeat protein